MKESWPLTVGGTSGESNIANICNVHFSAIANSVGSTDNRYQVINVWRTVPGYNDVINVHELNQIVKGLKNNKAVLLAMMELNLKSISLHLSDC